MNKTTSPFFSNRIIFSHIDQISWAYGFLFVFFMLSCSAHVSTNDLNSRSIISIINSKNKWAEAFRKLHANDYRRVRTNDTKFDIWSYCCVWYFDENTFGNSSPEPRHIHTNLLAAMITWSFVILPWINYINSEVPALNSRNSKKGR